MKKIAAVLLIFIGCSSVSEPELQIDPYSYIDINHIVRGLGGELVVGPRYLVDTVSIETPNTAINFYEKSNIGVFISYSYFGVIIPDDPNFKILRIRVNNDRLFLIER